MKNYLLGIVTVLALLAIFSFTGILDQHELPEKKWIIESKYLHLQDGIDKKEATEWIEKNYLPVYREFPGFNAILGEHTGGGLWGGEWTVDPVKGDLVIFYIFDSKRTKDFYFPKDGPWNDLIKNAMQKYPIVDDFFRKYVDKEKYQMNEYTIFASAK